MSGVSFDPDTSIPDLSGHVYLVTGGTAGLGAGAISLLAAKNPAKIFFTGRNRAKADELMSQVKKTSTSTELVFLECDQSSLASVQQAAKQFLAQSDRLDVLMCNAGIMGPPPGLSKDGYEIQFATNHLGHALFIKLLLPTLLHTAEQPGSDVRIIILSSLAHATVPQGGIEFSSLKTPQESLGPFYQPSKFMRYGQSKLANLLYPIELAKVYPSITSVAVHPGVVQTKIITSMGFMDRLMIAIVKWKSILSGQRNVSFEEGPYNQVWAATTPKENLKNGAYYEPFGKLMPPGTSYGKDPAVAKKLYDWTEQELAAFG